MTLDIVCQVVDNFGDIAVCWRLAQALVEDGGPDLEVRLLVDDWVALRALYPGAGVRTDQRSVDSARGSVALLDSHELTRLATQLRPADVLVEAFGAPTPPVWLEAFLAQAATLPAVPKILLHLEYLTAEAWSERYHRLASPLGYRGVERFFFVPGFRELTGGLVFTDASPSGNAMEVARQLRGVEDWLVTLFAYEHDFTAFWEDLTTVLAETNKTARVLVFAGRSQAGALASWQKVSARGGTNRVTVVAQPFVDQDTYTALIQEGDFHVVRGEESWVQAVLSGRPFLWHAYLQPEGHQSVKVEAFLELWKPWFETEGPEGLRVFEAVAREFRAFNARTVNQDQDLGTERYRPFFDNQALLRRVGAAWSSHLRKNAKLSRRMLEFLKAPRL